MFEDNEKEVVETEEIKEEETKAEETKTEETAQKSGTKYHLIQENFKKALMWAIIACGIDTVVWILTAIFDGVIDNNVCNILDCVIYGAGCAGLIFAGIVELKLFIGKTNPNKGVDLASFLISLITFILAFICAFWFGIDSIQHLVWFFRGL